MTETEKSNLSPFAYPLLRLVDSGGVGGPNLVLWPSWPHRTPQTPKQLRSQKSDSKVTFGGHPKVTLKVTQKWLFGDSKVTQNWPKSHFWVTFGVTLGWPPKVTFESLFCDLNCFGVWGVLWGQEGHNTNLVLPLACRKRTQAIEPACAALALLWLSEMDSQGSLKGMSLWSWFLRNYQKYHASTPRTCRTKKYYAVVNFGHFLRGGNGRGGIPHPGERYNVCPQWCRDTRTVTQVRHHLLC